jgi:hypothetical protein
MLRRRFRSINPGGWLLRNRPRGIRHFPQAKVCRVGHMSPPFVHLRHHRCFLLAE